MPVSRHRDPDGSLAPPGPANIHEASPDRRRCRSPLSAPAAASVRWLDCLCGGGPPRASGTYPRPPGRFPLSPGPSRRCRLGRAACLAGASRPATVGADAAAASPGGGTGRCPSSASRKGCPRACRCTEVPTRPRREAMPARGSSAIRGRVPWVDAMRSRGARHQPWNLDMRRDRRPIGARADAGREWSQPARRRPASLRG